MSIASASALRSAASSAIASTRTVLTRSRPSQCAFASSSSARADVNTPPTPPPNASSEAGAKKPKSAHGALYGTTFPAMIPVFLLGSAVYLGLQLTQLTLSHEKAMEAAQERVRVLEAEIDALQAQHQRPTTTASTSVSTPGSSLNDERLHLAAAGAGKAASWWKWW